MTANAGWTPRSEADWTHRFWQAPSEMLDLLLVDLLWLLNRVPEFVPSASPDSLWASLTFGANEGSKVRVTDDGGDLVLDQFTPDGVLFETVRLTGAARATAARLIADALGWTKR